MELTDRENASIWVVIPAFNEGSVIRDTIAGLKQYFKSIVVVDDKSSDETVLLSLESGAVVCRHPVNLGQGAALQTGIDYALEAGAEIVITFDADGQHRPIDAVNMLNEMTKAGVDVVLASRFLGATEDMPPIKGMILRLATLYTRLTTGLKLTDTHNGLRVLSRRAATLINLRQNRMAHASELLEQVSKMKISYIEHPVTIVYTDYSRAKGQRISGALAIMSDLYVRRMFK